MQASARTNPPALRIVPWFQLFAFSREQNGAVSRLTLSGELRSGLRQPKHLELIVHRGGTATAFRPATVAADRRGGNRAERRRGESGATLKLRFSIPTAMLDDRCAEFRLLARRHGTLDLPWPVLAVAEEEAGGLRLSVGALAAAAGLGAATLLAAPAAALADGTTPATQTSSPASSDATPSDAAGADDSTDPTGTDPTGDGTDPAQCADPTDTSSDPSDASTDPSDASTDPSDTSSDPGDTDATDPGGTASQCTDDSTGTDPTGTGTDPSGTDTSTTAATDPTGTGSSPTGTTATTSTTDTTATTTTTPAPTVTDGSSTDPTATAPTTSSDAPPAPQTTVGADQTTTTVMPTAPAPAATAVAPVTTTATTTTVTTTVKKTQPKPSTGDSSSTKTTKSTTGTGTTGSGFGESGFSGSSSSGSGTSGMGSSGSSSSGSGTSGMGSSGSGADSGSDLGAAGSGSGSTGRSTDGGSKDGSASSPSGGTNANGGAASIIEQAVKHSTVDLQLGGKVKHSEHNATGSTSPSQGDAKSSTPSHANTGAAGSVEVSTFSQLSPSTAGIWGGGSIWTNPFTAAQLENFSNTVDGIPMPAAGLIKIYKAAARKYNLPWEILAAINFVETDYGTDLSLSTAGAEGWMEFMPGTWAEYGEAVSRRGRILKNTPGNPWDARDAIYSAARLLVTDGAHTNLARAVYGYNHAGWYVQKVLTTAEELTSDTLKENVARRAREEKVAPVHPLSEVQDREFGEAAVASRSEDGAAIVTDELTAMRTSTRLLDGIQYTWGGGHTNWVVATGYDCSGFVSEILHSAGYLTSPQTTQTLPGQTGIAAGAGKWVTIYDRTDDAIDSDHVIIDIDGQWWESGGSGLEGGAERVHRIYNVNAGYLKTFNLRLHPVGL